MSNSDYLIHYKYIKREWKNGKWVYTYPDGTTHKVGRTLDTLGYHKKADAIDKIIDHKVASYNFDVADASTKSKPNDDTRKKLSQEATDAAIDAGSALREYYKTPIGRLDKLDDKIDAGRTFIADMLQGKLPKVSNAIRPDKEYLSWIQKKR